MANTSGPQASIGNGQTMNYDAARYWNAMVAEIYLKTGISIVPTEGTRTWNRQNELYQLYRAGRGNPAWSPNDARAYHLSGRAVDVGSSVGFVNTNNARVFRAYAGMYGFRETVHGEPWHFEWRSDWVTINLAAKELELMALTNDDIAKMWNYAAYTGGPTFSQVMKDLHTGAAPVLTRNGKITKLQDDANTNTNVMKLMESVAKLQADITAIKEGK